MIDCTKTENYFAEKARMTRATESEYGICKINCKKCPLYPTNNWTSENLSCVSFKKNYPNVSLEDDGTPNFCPYRLGLMGADDCRKDGNCVKCWNQAIEESESK